LAVVGVLFLFVFPARTYLDQRRSLSATEARLRVLGAQNASLQTRVARLHDDAEIERLARKQYGLVKPGEEAYAILPPAAAPPPPAPAPAARPPDRGWFHRLWHSLF